MLQNARYSEPIILFLLWIGSLIAFLTTMPPGLYTVDTPELIAAAVKLGIPHSPGYSLYTLLAHIMTQLPLGDNPAYRVNLFSVLCLWISLALIFVITKRITGDSWLAASGALIFGFSYYIWTVSLVAEVYAPQILTLTICGYALLRLRGDQSIRNVIFVGVSYGIAVAMHPMSALFAPGMAAVFVWLRIPLQKSALAGGLSILIFALSLTYFPIRYDADPPLNTAGSYDETGTFQAQNLQSVDGLWWLLSGRQFESMMFADGLLPSSQKATDTLSWFWGNYLGLGLVAGLFGIVVLARRHRAALFIWLIFFVPYTYFFLTYGALDRETMFGPSFLLWLLVLVIGVQAAFEQVSPNFLRGCLVLAPLVLLVINYPLVNVSENRELRDRNEEDLINIPPETYVFGHWGSIAPLEYYQIVENRRPDLTFYKLFLFDGDKDRLQSYVDSLLAQGETVLFLEDSAHLSLDSGRYLFTDFDQDFNEETGLTLDVFLTPQ